MSLQTRSSVQHQQQPFNHMCDVDGGAPQLPATVRRMPDNARGPTDRNSRGQDQAVVVGMIGAPPGFARAQELPSSNRAL
ncbi:MAG: hypothetical protein Q8O67_12645 [Deltaproteobacteria bacterium]|nr:hypothetical protein [Deltaproteobacteria bacterium]